MAFGDLLLHLDSYPEPTREADIDAAIAFAAAIGGKLTALGIRVTIPAESNRIADYLIGLSKIVREQEKQSHIAAREGLEAFTRKATHAGVYSDALLARADLYDVPDLVARVAHSIAFLTRGQRAIPGRERRSRRGPPGTSRVALPPNLRRPPDPRKARTRGCPCRGTSGTPARRGRRP